MVFLLQPARLPLCGNSFHAFNWPESLSMADRSRHRLSPNRAILNVRRPAEVGVMVEPPGRRTIDYPSGMIFSLSCIAMTAVAVGPLTPGNPLSFTVPIVFFALGLSTISSIGRSFRSSIDDEWLFMSDYRRTGRARYRDFAIHRSFSALTSSIRETRLIAGRFLVYAAVLLVVVAISGLFLIAQETLKCMRAIGSATLVYTGVCHILMLRSHLTCRSAHLAAKSNLQMIVRELSPDKVLRRTGVGRGHRP